jgi:hypothetical protein
VSEEIKIRKEQAVRELFECYKQIEALKEKSSYSPEFLRWRRETEAMIERLFGKKSDEVQNFTAIYYNPLFLSCRTGEADFEEAYREGLEQARKMIVSWIESLGREAVE